MMTRSQIEKGAKARGLTVHESVTDERLARINTRMLNSQPEKLAKKHAKFLDATAQEFESWLAQGCRIASYDLGEVGGEVIGPPTVMADLGLVVLPSFHIVAKCGGDGECNDGDRTAAVAVTYTILA